ncbi:MAG: prepilin-type N-terminal cleavage/methylation domain-containing protein [Verrucomicrobia bacterium]|nr:prepilin-type N-terminal cleavage/methylation domain-containing protein [Verrucomicrobiota bacterium]
MTSFTQQGRKKAYTMIEIMVAMTMMSVIVVGLLATLNQTQKTLKAAGGQSDTLEGGRAFMALVSREIKELALFPESVTNTFRFYSFVHEPATPLMQNIPNLPEKRTNLLSSFGLVTLDKEFNRWRLVLYDVDLGEWRTNRSTAVYRMETNFPIYRLEGFPGTDLMSFQSRFHFTNGNRINASRDTNLFTKVLDGVVSLRIHAYDINGTRIRDWLPNTVPFGYSFTNSSPLLSTNYRPASLEVELGVLDPEIHLKVKSMESPSVASTFLQDRVANVQVFRQRISVPTGP